MDKIIEILKQFGIDDQSIFLRLMILGIAIPIILTILKFGWKAIQFLILQKNQKLLNRDLSPFFSDGDVKKATQFYIPTKFQNVSPSEDDEPSSKFIASAKQKIIPLFLKKVFKSDGDDNKYYLILADSGMGKTTFMINLFLNYKNQNTWFGLKTKHNIVLFPLGWADDNNEDVLKEIEKIEDKRNTILLLDAFDEDIKAVKDHRARMKEILSVAKRFREVVITCRTQFFPSEEEVPTEAGYIKTYGDGGTEYKFQKLYLSVFDDKDIKRYLRKRFSILQFSKRKKAKKIVEKSSNLVMRPMLLSYINDLVDEEKGYKYSYEVYEILIEKWIKRESDKHGISEKYGSSENYKKLLYGFSQELAVNLYQNTEKRGGYFIKHDEILTTQLQLGDVEKYEDSEKDLKGKSLLNRNAQSQYKFAHKSIFEYFLAKRCFEDNEFLETFNFEGMSICRNFLDEMMVENFSKLEGEFSVFKLSNKQLREHYKFRLADIKITDIYVMNSLKITRLNDFNLLLLSSLPHISEITVFDKKKMSSLYDLYSVFYFLSLLKPERLVQERLELRERLERLERLELRERLARLELRERLERLERLEPRERQERLERLELQELLELQERLERLKLHFNKSDEKLLKELKPINDFLKEMKELEKKLPNCKMYY